MGINAASRAWRPYLRLSIRGLVVLVLLLGGWLGWLVRSARTQQEVVVAITSAGGSVTEIRYWPGESSVSPGTTWVPGWLRDFIGVDYFATVTGVHVPDARAEALRQVGRLPKLRTLSIDSSSVSDEGLAHLKGLTNLSVLTLYRDPFVYSRLDHLPPAVSEQGLTHLGPLTSLSVLVLNGIPLTDAGLVHLSGLRKLRRLDLWYTQITGSGFVYLAGLTGLTRLDLGGTPVTDAALAQLEELPNLLELDLAYTGVSDAGLVRLTRLSKLTKLGLNSTRVTDEGIGHLARLRNLVALDLTFTRVTDAAVNDLKRSLPRLVVYR
jgi:Leucine-rich repeat (LRR) protein